MEFKLKKVITIGTLVIGSSVTFAVPMAYADDNGKIVLNMTPAAQTALYALIAEMNFVNGNGQVRVLVPGENLEVQAHEESDSISFSTLDGYTVNLKNSTAYTPSANIGGVVLLENAQLLSR